MQIRETSCKTALSPSKLPGLDYSLNPYIGCAHQCQYCYVPTVLHLSKKQWQSTVTLKRNIPLVLSKELRSKKPGIIGISTVTDPYQPIEKTVQLTRHCLVQLLKKDFPVNVQTKSSLVVRDKDLLSEFSQAELLVSIATLNDRHRKLLEPTASSIKERLKIFEEFKNTSIKKTVFFGPYYPMSKQELFQMVMTFSDLEVSTILIDRFHMKKGTHASLMNATKNTPSFQSKLHFQLTYQDEQYDLMKSWLLEAIQDTSLSCTEAF